MFKQLFHTTLITLFLLAGCGGGEFVIPAPLNESAFTTFPSNAAVDIQTDSVITVDFGQEMDSRTINSDTFVVAGPAVQVQGEVSYAGTSATFSPLKKLALATTYTATLKAGIKDKTGNASQSDFSWSFKTRSGVWYTPVIIESGNQDAFLPNIEMNKPGNATAAWVQSDGNFNRIYANRFDVNEGWGNEIAIDPAFAKGNYEPEIAMDDDGNAIAVWAISTNNQYILYSNFYTRVALSWTGAGPVVGGAFTNSLVPKVAMDPDGNAIAVWAEVVNGRPIVYSDQFIFDSFWTGPTVIQSSSDYAGSPQIAFDSFGNAVTIWALGDIVTLKSSMSADYRAAGSGWGQEIPISERTGYVSFPDLAVNADGEAIAVWWQVDGNTKSIYANHYTPGTGWGAAAPVKSNIIIFDILPTVGPRVAMDSAGNAVAVWQESEGIGTPTINRYMYSSRYTPESGWETAELVGSCGDWEDCKPNIDMDPNGNATAIWQKSDQTGGRRSIYTKHYILGSGWDVEAAYIGGGRLNATDPKVAVDEQGRASAIWLQYDGSYWNVVSARFE